MYLIICCTDIMSLTPFKDTAKQVNRKLDYVAMQVHSDGARSHGWWRNLVEHGAWAGPGRTRVGPPDLEALDGIAKLFGTTPEQVAAMVAADWYGVHPNNELSPLVLRMGPAIDHLDEVDAGLVELLIRRLETGGYGPSERELGKRLWHGAVEPRADRPIAPPSGD
jgi:hypothetical protein